MTQVTEKTSMLSVITIPVLSDNYIFIIRNDNSDETAVVDPAIAEPVLKILKKEDWPLTYIINTHHHTDHTGGNQRIKEQTGCKIIGFKGDAQRIPGINWEVSDEEVIDILGSKVQILFTPGHTLGHIVYYFEKEQLLFCGDTLFSMGCGRLFEGTPEQMYKSLGKLALLPGDTNIYCAHEYSQNNGEFALTLEPENQDLIKRMAEVRQLRLNNKATIPSTIKQELLTNPFLRSHSTELQKNIMPDEKDPDLVEVFATTRRLKDIY